MTMRMNIAQAKAQLSSLLKRVKAGETIVICERNIPIAELCPINESQREPRALTAVWPGWTVPDSFFEPLPEDVIAAFEGRSS